MDKLFNNSFLSDITLEINDRKIYAHRAILYQIPYFEKLFTNNLIDSSSKTHKFSTTDSELTYETLYIFLMFVYKSGQLPRHIDSAELSATPKHVQIIDIGEATEMFMYKPFIKHTIDSYVNLEATTFPVALIYRILTLAQKHITPDEFNKRFLNNIKNEQLVHLLNDFDPGLMQYTLQLFPRNDTKIKWLIPWIALRTLNNSLLPDDISLLSKCEQMSALANYKNLMSYIDIEPLQKFLLVNTRNYLKLSGQAKNVGNINVPTNIGSQKYTLPEDELLTYEEVLSIATNGDIKKTEKVSSKKNVLEEIVCDLYDEKRKLYLIHGTDFVITQIDLPEQILLTGIKIGEKLRLPTDLEVKFVKERYDIDFDWNWSLDTVPKYNGEH